MESEPTKAVAEPLGLFVARLDSAPDRTPRFAVLDVCGDGTTTTHVPSPPIGVRASCAGAPLPRDAVTANVDRIAVAGATYYATKPVTELRGRFLYAARVGTANGDAPVDVLRFFDFADGELRIHDELGEEGGGEEDRVELDEHATFTLLEPGLFEIAWDGRAPERAWIVSFGASHEYLRFEGAGYLLRID
jgi:hypothetical protein